MAKYTKTLRKAWAVEVASLREKAQIEANRLKSAKQLLQVEPSKLLASQKQQLQEVLQHSAVLKTMHEMREELARSGNAPPTAVSNWCSNCRTGVPC
jgi:stearoyl-CoA desaturase (delta-9 desaturase)